MFIIGRIFILLIDYRFNRRKVGMKARINTYITNIGIAGSRDLFCWGSGLAAFLLIQGPISKL
ncbi:hypothetical protein [Paenibacillus qinlingensis]|uniref:Uncharacterized protein n=1 Tax=Paenibacillus qinlingensis TaxID=1837343 RepID=A0ABU1NY97_9BACL|nr:hypothetical protein [Paenibacillus qinlingensis]MDR6552477.1 hypothetical protein [Paenibacillus qinlingensis]